MFSQPARAHTIFLCAAVFLLIVNFVICAPIDASYQPLPSPSPFSLIRTQLFACLFLCLEEETQAWWVYIFLWAISLLRLLLYRAVGMMSLFTLLLSSLLTNSSEMPGRALAPVLIQFTAPMPSRSARALASFWPSLPYSSSGSAYPHRESRLFQPSFVLFLNDHILVTFVFF